MINIDQACSPGEIAQWRLCWRPIVMTCLGVNRLIDLPMMCCGHDVTTYQWSIHLTASPREVVLRVDFPEILHIVGFSLDGVFPFEMSLF